jgi:hypothetical protein
MVAARPKRRRPLDPSRTATLRLQLAAALKREFALLRLDVVRLVREDDAFGLGLSPSPFSLNAFCATGVGGGQDNSCAAGKGGPSGRGTAVVARARGAARSVGAGVGAVSGKAKALEHFAKHWAQDKVQAGIDRLPPKGQKVAGWVSKALRVGTRALFANWTLGQTLAERVAVARGSSPEQAKKLRGVLSGIDLKAFEAFKVPALLGVHAAHLPAYVTGTVPIASTAYLAYSGARNPLKTAGAALGLVKEGLSRFKGKGAVKRPGRDYQPTIEQLPARNLAANAGPASAVRAVDERLAAQGYDDWHVHLFLAGLDAGLPWRDALDLADELYGTSKPPEGEDTDADAAALFGEPSSKLDEGLTGNADSPKRPFSAGFVGASDSDAPTRPPAVNALWGLLPDPDKAAAFRQWLAGRLRDISGRAGALLRNATLAAYRKGVSAAYGGVKALKGASLSGLLPQDREGFTRLVVTLPAARDTLRSLGARLDNDLDGLLDGAEADLLRTLHDHLSRGSDPQDVAKALSDRLGVYGARAAVQGGTAVVRAQAEGQLDGFERLGVEEVEGDVEAVFTTARDGRVCPRCREMEGVRLPLSKARGLIPAHLACRCAWKPSPPTLTAPTPSPYRPPRLAFAPRVEPARNEAVEAAGLSELLAVLSRPGAPED